MERIKKMSRRHPIFKVDVTQNVPMGTSITQENLGWQVFVLHFVNTIYGGNLKLYNLTYEVNVMNIFTDNSTDKIAKLSNRVSI
jgi:hypothetical protein